MSRAIRIAVGSAALAAGLAIAGASPANAQVRFRGAFPVPHGRIQVNIGGGGYGYGGYGGGYGAYGAFPIGGYVPYGYDVYEDPDYGWGFVYDNQWFACEPRGSQFIIIAAPVFYGGGGYRNYGYRNYNYGRNYSYGRNYGYVRPYSNDRYYSRDNRYSNRNYDRNWSRNDRSSGRNDRNWSRNDRSGSRNDRRDGDHRSGGDRRNGDWRRHN